MRCVHYWLQGGAQVKALTRGAVNPLNHSNLTWVIGDLEQPQSLKTVTEPFATIVIFTAPLWLLPPLMPVLIERGVKRVIAFSSTSVHTKKDSGKAYEREMVEKLRESEDALFAIGKEKNIGVTILRPTLIYGVGTDKNVASIARVMRALPFFPVPFGAKGLRQPVHADDLAMATIQVADVPATFGKAYDIGGSERLTYRELLSRISREMKKSIILLPVPAFAWMLDIGGKCLGRPHRINGEIARRMQKDMVFDHQAAVNDFGWNPRPFLDHSSQPNGVPFF